MSYTQANGAGLPQTLADRLRQRLQHRMSPLEWPNSIVSLGGSGLELNTDRDLSLVPYSDYMDAETDFIGPLDDYTEMLKHLPPRTPTSPMFRKEFVSPDQHRPLGYEHQYSRMKSYRKPRSGKGAVSFRRDSACILSTQHKTSFKSIKTGSSNRTRDPIVVYAAERYTILSRYQARRNYLAKMQNAGKSTSLASHTHDSGNEIIITPETCPLCRMGAPLSISTSSSQCPFVDECPVIPVLSSSGEYYQSSSVEDDTYIDLCDHPSREHCDPRTSEHKHNNLGNKSDLCDDYGYPYLFSNAEGRCCPLCGRGLKAFTPFGGVNHLVIANSTGDTVYHYQCIAMGWMSDKELAAPDMFKVLHRKIEMWGAYVSGIEAANEVSSVDDDSGMSTCTEDDGSCMDFRQLKV
ncbi:hypothetical protein H2198_002927 [Neophaeococcomyces mojaviensis]|uniref:Uncharacterized protein n=1 Tax=Neophaeococcomyces mojaviensis TaxID=3383035 RepID=A0ACC3ACY3_9EURO|nr:hypothetical protein H2198_002927 [Knufia sp. JES_112]